MPLRRLPNAVLAQRALGYVTDTAIAIDGGAHTGEWTALLSERFTKVHAYEPVTHLHNALVTRFAGDPGVVVHKEALLDVAGRGSVIHPGGGKKQWAQYIMPFADGDVSVVTLDDFEFNQCGLLKLDLEGAELLALRGARKLLVRSHPVIVLECKRRTSERYDWDLDNLENWLGKMGYHLVFFRYPNRVYIHNGNALLPQDSPDRAP